MRVHYLNNVNKALHILEQNNVSILRIRFLFKILKLLTAAKTEWVLIIIRKNADVK